MPNRLYLILTFLIVSIIGVTLTFTLTDTAVSHSFCREYNGIPDGPESTGGMVWVKPGSFIMGNDKGHKDLTTGNYQPFPEEKYEHEVSLDGFWIDRTEVTNAQFSRFVEATGYVTIAEQKPKKEWFPVGFPEDQMVAGSAVFIPPDRISSLSDIGEWWEFVEGANWRQPQGPGSSIVDKMNHPVVHVTHKDALAYAKWAGRGLPTEAQWEYAAKGGLTNVPYAWGRQFQIDGKHMANTWQGDFPVNDLKSDGYAGTAPVGCYPENGYGLYDMVGNVWEIVSDNYQPQHSKQSANNPTGRKESFDQPDTGAGMYVIKGGSYLCAANYCMRYRPSARQGQEYTFSTSHIGFRTVLNEM